MKVINKLILFFIILIVLSISVFAKHIHKEKYYQKIFCDSMNGRMEVPIKEKGKSTRIDCVFEENRITYGCEVDFGHKFYESVGQAEYYSYKTNTAKCIVLIQETKNDNRYIGRAKSFCRDKKIILYIINKKKEITKL